MWVTQCHSVFMKRWLKDCFPPTLHDFVCKIESYFSQPSDALNLRRTYFFSITSVVDIIPVDGEEFVLTAASGIHFLG
ncbi:hypothetical protein CEXT_92251 [Caerostris extrusa]|uniref:Uncharacterized protein n=1 Tax=Caerostris extrusa TaxID=172846 RepID=A0AAV4PUR6_CAEEX|nr:hypothetical protein CEXT_92251 [Caerostris extrusa]